MFFCRGTRPTTEESTRFAYQSTRSGIRTSSSITSTYSVSSLRCLRVEVTLLSGLGLERVVPGPNSPVHQQFSLFLTFARRLPRSLSHEARETRLLFHRCSVFQCYLAIMHGSFLVALTLTYRIGRYVQCYRRVYEQFRPHCAVVMLPGITNSTEWTD